MKYLTLVLLAGCATAPIIQYVCPKCGNPDVVQTERRPMKFSETNGFIRTVNYEHNAWHCKLCGADWQCNRTVRISQTPR